MNQKLLNILRCPETGVPLKPMDSDKLNRLNRLITAQQIRTCQGRMAVAPLAEALITEDHRRVYRIHDDIPVLLIEEGIHTEPLAMPEE